MKKLLIYLFAALLMVALLSGPAAANTDADSNANGCVQVTDQVEGFFNGAYATGPLVDPVWGGGYVVSTFRDGEYPVENGNGTTFFPLTHTFYSVNFGTLVTKDHVVAAPTPTEGVFHINDLLQVTSGDWAGYMHTNGTLDMRTGDLRLSLHGLLCRAG